MSPADCTRQAAEAASRLAAAKADAEAARDDIAKAIEAGIPLGVEINEFARVTGLSRQTIRTLRQRA